MSETIVRDNLTSTISLHDFGKAMAEIDLSSVPPHKRMAAITDHLVHIMAGTLTDPDRADALAASWAKKVLGITF